MTRRSWINFASLSVLFPSIFIVLQANDTRNFVRTSSSRLTSMEAGIILERRQVINQMSCGQWCSRTEKCRSFNLEKNSGQPERICELLSVDKNQRQDLLNENNNYDHYTSTVRNTVCCNNFTRKPGYFPLVRKQSLFFVAQFNFLIKYSPLAGQSSHA